MIDRCFGETIDIEDYKYHCEKCFRYYKISEQVNCKNCIYEYKKEKKDACPYCGYCTLECSGDIEYIQNKKIEGIKQYFNREIKYYQEMIERIKERKSNS